MGLPGGGEPDRRSADQNFSFIRLIKPRHHLDQGGLAGPVLAKQRMNLAPAHVKGYILQRMDAGERLGDTAKLDGERHPSIDDKKSDAGIG